MDIVAENEAVVKSWSKIREEYAVPKSLYRHQADTIALVLRGEQVFSASPTGSGKTLAQLCTVLFTSGLCHLSIPFQHFQDFYLQELH